MHGNELDLDPARSYRLLLPFAEALPDEMIARFKQTPGAWDFYQAQPKGYRKHTRQWVTSAKREATRARRLATLIDDSANGLRIKQLRKG